MRYALIYGGIAGAIVITVLCIGLFADLPSHFQSEVFGYLVMLVALSLIFVGIKRYRDVDHGGVIRFGRAFGMGLGIAAVATIIYIIGWELALALGDPNFAANFMAEYSAGIVENMRASGASAGEIAAKQAEMALWGERYQSPLWRIPITFVEIFPVGLVVALLSALILRNPRVLPARASA